MADYGCTIYDGSFWQGKTFTVHSWLSFLWFIKNFFRKTRPIFIGNYTSPDFDIEFRSRDDLQVILEHLRLYKRQMNTRPVFIVMDEAELYLNTRDFSTFPPWVRPFLFQVRKLDIRFTFISPKVFLLDKFIRWVSDFLIRIHTVFIVFRIITRYSIESEEVNVKDETSVTPAGFSIRLIPFLHENFLNMFGIYTLYYTKEFIDPTISYMRGDLWVVMPIADYSRTHLEYLHDLRASIDLRSGVSRSSIFLWVSIIISITWLYYLIPFLYSFL